MTNPPPGPMWTPEAEAAYVEYKLLGGPLERDEFERMANMWPDEKDPRGLVRLAVAAVHIQKAR